MLYVSMQRICLSIEAHNTGFQELDLSDKTRRFYKSGKILRRPDGTGFTDWTEAHLILLDHYST